MEEQKTGTIQGWNETTARDLPPAIVIILVLCTMVSILTVFTMVVCMVLDGLSIMAAPLSLFLALGAVVVAGCFAIPLAVALVWSVILMVASAVRPVRTAFKGVFGFVNQAMQVASIPFLP